ncbi:FKBP-type peptidyl-prolyl cis-trans isomerase [Cellulophaga sp. Hel_I_12]|uniref:FKBP-type peptidyl-prolyl cis-trans isomerase n=1 Tax=Cellulophaga sp. Hel_I_12 TaxID=1249972 RepID=UPI0006457BA5|nr:FKBP-type peptidyl-prolyl cis-trans isomerase [Cellulophaga sp. Hel_I_12]
MKYCLLFVCLLLSISSCSEDKENQTIKDYSAQNELEIQAYVAENNLMATRSNSGLYYVIDNPGTGQQPVSNSRVTVIYKGYYLNGKVFDDSNGDGVTFGLNQVIPGWTEGITYFKEGGSGTLIVPSQLGYGSLDYRGIPGGSVLIFDITLSSVN